MKKSLIVGVGGLILLFAFVTSVSAVKAATCHDGMVSYWKFDEGSGSTAADSIGTDNGQLIGDGLTWAAGKVGDALQFGSASWVSMSDSGLPAGSNPRTVEAWIKTSDSGTGAIFVYGYLPLDGGYSLLGKNYPGSVNNIWVSSWGHEVTAWVNILDGQWHHVASTFFSGNYKIYVDGILERSGYMPTNTVLWGNGITGAYIGAYRGYDYYDGQYYHYKDGVDQFRGQIDEVAIYNRDLTAEEIQQEYQHGLAGEGYCDFPPVIAAHENIVAEATSPEGAVVNYTLPIATDDRDESITVTCTPVSGSTFMLGDTTVSCSATDASGNHAIDTTFTVTVNYNWNGFFQPVDNLPTLNLVKAGSARPVKFSLNGNMGLNIFAKDYPKSTNVVCGKEALTDDIKSTVTAGGSSLTYDPVANQYVYVWKTDKAWTTSCRQLMVKLNDGTTKYANFKFK
jgi:hypothetical protein